MCIITNVLMTEDDLLNDLAHIFKHEVNMEELWSTLSFSSFDRLDVSSVSKSSGRMLATTTRSKGGRQVFNTWRTWADQEE
jgi:hypothetical protein